MTKEVRKAIQRISDALGRSEMSLIGRDRQRKKETSENGAGVFDVADLADENSQSTFEVAGIVDENSESIMDLAEYAARLEERIEALEQKGE